MPLPQKKLIPGILLALIITALAAPPLWWSTANPPVIDPAASVNNRGPANIGQAKHMAKSALDALRPILPDVADAIEVDLAAIVDLTVPDPKPVGWSESKEPRSSSASSRPSPIPSTPTLTPPRPTGSKPSASPMAPIIPGQSSHGQPPHPTITTRAWRTSDS